MYMYKLELHLELMSSFISYRSCYIIINNYDLKINIIHLKIKHTSD